MDEAGHLSAASLQHVWRTLESATAVRHRGEMFLWAQGGLQALIPHGLMLCLMFNGERKVIHSDCLQAVVLNDALLDNIRDPTTGLLVQLERHCHEQGLVSLDLHGDPGRPMDPAHPLADLAMAWADLGLGPGLFQSSGPLANGMSSFFAVTSLKHPPDASHKLILQVLLPQLHVALSRSQRWHAQTAAPAAADEAQAELSERQLEILRWVKLGKTNFEISMILTISELTVKNHLQKIFKKLNVHNRTQAVARIMELRLC